MAEQIHCQVSEDAKGVLISWQKEHGFRQQGAALENLLLEFAWMKADEADHIDECEPVRMDVMLEPED
jgi:hypothetical protein